VKVPIDTDRLRRDEFKWMCAGDTVYMNAASTGPLPQRSIDAQVDFTRRRATPHLVGFDDQFGALARCRELVAELINASTAEIALAINTGTGINLAAWGLPLGPGDEVVVPDAEFPANMYPWLAAAEARDFAVHLVPLRNGILDNDALLAALDRPNVRALSVSWVGFSNGAVADLDRLSAACRSRGVYFIVDGIQGLGAFMLDVERTPVDIFACGAQKWLLGPWGSGFTYVRREVMASITPQPVSWMAVRGSDDFSRLIEYDLTWRDDARRFEQVTLPYQDFFGMAASLELLHELGPRAVSEHILRCAQALLTGARERGVALVTPEDNHGGTASVRPPDAMAASARLDAASVIHSVREGTIRLAPHCYTNADDIERTLAALVA
jgi:selenocysteine lyase/cysteine desulfurase